MAFSPIEAQKYLKGMSNPASKQDVVDHAKSGRRAPGGDLESQTEANFENPGEVQKAFSKS